MSGKNSSNTERAFHSQLSNEPIRADKTSSLSRLHTLKRRRKVKGLSARQLLERKNRARKVLRDSELKHSPALSL